MEAPFTPAPQYLMVVPDEITKKIGSIHLPENRTSETIFKGTVIAAGRDVEGSEDYVGRRIIFGRFTGTKVEYEGQEYIMLEKRYVLGFLRD